MTLSKSYLGLTYGICKMGAVLVPVSLGVVRTQQMLVSYHIPLAGKGTRDTERKERTEKSIRLWEEEALGETREGPAELARLCVWGDHPAQSFL